MTFLFRPLPAVPFWFSPIEEKESRLNISGFLLEISISLEKFTLDLLISPNKKAALVGGSLAIFILDPAREILIFINLWALRVKI